MTTCGRAHLTSWGKINIVSSASIELHLYSDLQAWVWYDAYSNPGQQIFNSSTGSNRNVILDVDEPNRPMRRLNERYEFFHHMTRASWEVLAPEDKNKDKWTPALEDRDSREAYIGDEDIDIEDEELELYCDQSQMTEHSTQVFVVCSKVKNMIAAEMENLTSTVMLLCWLG